MIFLISSENTSLSNLHMDFLEASCFTDNDYKIIFEDHLSTFVKLLLYEKVNNSYRK